MTDSLKTVRPASLYGVGFEYNHWSGRPTEIRDAYNGRTLQFGYNDQGQADTIFVRGNQTRVSARNSNRQMLTRLFEGVDLKQTQQYSATNRRAEIKWLKNSSGATLVSRNLGFDESDRITDMGVEGSSLYQYEYDRLGRLTKSEQYDLGEECTYSPYYPYIDCDPVLNLAEADTFTYDAIGNRTDHGAAVGAGSRLTQITVHGKTVNYTYDDAGNVTRREEVGGKDQYLYWNALGQLDSVKTINGQDTTVSRYRYDAFGQRIRIQDGSEVLESMWVDGHVLFDVEGSTATEYAYYTGTDRPHSMRRDGQTYHFLTDHLGSVAAVVDSTGTKKNTYTYDVWGLGSCSEQVGNRIRYTGREYDGATGFYYLRARYYDPATGRFLSEDLLGGMNAYAYAANNPISFRDPSGLDEEDGDDDDDDGHYDCTDPRSPGGRQIVKGEVCDLNELRTRGNTGTGLAQILGFYGGSNPGAGGSSVSVGGAVATSRHQQQQPETETQDCTRALVTVGFNLALDASTVFGYGAVVRLGKAATLYRRVARTRGLNGGWLRGGQDMMAGAQVVDRIQVETFDNWMRSTIGPSVGKAGFTSALGGDVNWRPSVRGVMEFLTDVAPVVSTFKAGIQAVRACF